MADKLPVIAVVGGTGKLGAALARGWARAGYPVVVGSRDAGRAADTASALAVETGGTVTGVDNLAAAVAGEIVVITVPFAHQRRILEEIRPAAVSIIQRLPKVMDLIRQLRRSLKRFPPRPHKPVADREK